MRAWLGLAGRGVLIAGAGGIGAACASAFADVGARVALVDNDRDRLSHLERELKLRATGGHTLRADVRDAESCREAVAAAAGQLGRLDVFVHSVGINVRQPLDEFTDGQWDEIVTVNLSSAFWLGQAAGGLMREQRRGRMVFLSSVSGLLANRSHVPYAATKGGLNQLMRGMAGEWAGCGITVNAVAPGYIETPLTAEYLARPGVREEVTAAIPAGRLGTVDDVANAVLFLASDRASFITGHVLYVDGGRTLV